MVCQSEAPSVEEAHLRWADEVAFFGVANGGDDSSFQQFIDDHGLTFPQISDASGEIFERFSIPIQHAVVVVGPSGAVETMLGAVDEARLEQLLVEITS
jgi:peroxiredoxin